MRKVTFGGVNSLDSYLARRNYAVDWLLWGEEAADMSSFWETIDTVLMGRRTFEAGSEGMPGVIRMAASMSPTE